MKNINALTIFGHSVRITPTAEMLSSHSPNEDDYIKRLKEGTLTLMIGGFKWEILAKQTDFSPYLVDVQLRSLDRDPNFVLSTIVNIDMLDKIDEHIMQEFDSYPEAKAAFKEYIKGNHPNKVYR